ncbi:hypothetical protein [Vibrio sinaloensis]|uniref:hypothetical protein n=1 Tax=Photobacterium sp. (strain ATCC 43367) TaxID=379097 RepID=UPI00068CF026|nr:hypothetical protein [Vibrio sinaloensis]
MSDLQKLKNRRAKLKKFEERSYIRSVPKMSENNRHLKGQVDTGALTFADMSKEYSEHIRNFDTLASKEEANALLKVLDDQIDPLDHILEPVFLSLFDGTMRAFKIGVKQGITATRLYGECKSFSYDSEIVIPMSDSFTETLNEQEHIDNLAKATEYNHGKLTRDGTTINVRDVEKSKDKHFGDSTSADDEYEPGKTIFRTQEEAKKHGDVEQSAEGDHAISCAEICNNLSGNKALHPEDIKEIVNTEANLVITSRKNNSGANVGKFDKSRDELAQEAEQGFVIVGGKKKELSEEEIATRKNMVKKMDEAQQEIDFKTNTKVADNLLNDREVQKRMAVDASSAAGHQSIGDLVMFIIKPLYFELKDCFVKGIEEGVKATSFKQALSIRVTRLKDHVLNKAESMLKSGLLSFFKNFLSMLLEGIVNCFVGIFKSIFRMVKEGFKALMQIVPILRNEKTSMTQKGDAILKLMAGSLSIFASIGIESWLNSTGIGEPWSILISSLLTAVLTSLVMYLLDKMDLFALKEEARLNRIDEILALRADNIKEDMFSMVRVLS